MRSGLTELGAVPMHAGVQHAYSSGHPATPTLLFGQQEMGVWECVSGTNLQQGQLIYRREKNYRKGQKSQ